MSVFPDPFDHSVPPINIVWDRMVKDPRSISTGDRVDVYPTAHRTIVLGPDATVYADNCICFGPRPTIIGKGCICFALDAHPNETTLMMTNEDDVGLLLFATEGIVDAFPGPYSSLVRILLDLGMRTVLKTTVHRFNIVAPERRLSVPGGDDTPAPDDAPESSVCVVCFERMRAVVFVPCSHLAVCLTCARTLMPSPLCPVCRDPVKQMSRVRIV